MTASVAVSPGRIEGLDVARALAIFGMVLVNFHVVFVQVDEPEWLATISGQVNGRAAALFVFLAGIGISLLSRRSRRSGERAAIRADRMVLLKRALFLFVIGLAFRQIWDFDILHFYGIWLCLAALLLTAPNRLLAACAVLATVIFPLLFVVLPAQLGIVFWDTTDALTPRDIAVDLFFQGYHPVAPWFAFLLVGMIVGRLDLADRALRRRLLIGGVALALAGEALAFALLDLGILKLLPGMVPAADLEQVALQLGTAPYPPMPLFIVVGLGWAMAIVSLCLSAGERFAGRGWFTPFVHAGQLALTVYILHGSLGVWVIDWSGLGRAHTLAWELGYAAIFYVVIVALASLWRRRFERGPLEAVMRWLTASRRSEILPEGAEPV